MVKGFWRALALAVALPSQGCSFMFVDGPPDRHETLAYFDCTSSAGPEVADAIMAVTWGLATAGTAESDSGGTAVVGAIAGTFAASAIYGIVKTQACNNAKDELRIRLLKVFEREAQFRAMEKQRERPRDLERILRHPSRLPTRKRVPPTAPAPAPAPATDELPPAPPPPPAVAPAPAPAAPASSALPPPPPAPTAAPAPAPAPVR
jgi:hypothetical protein